MFSAELLNRVDETVAFRFLTRNDGKMIAEKMLADLRERCADAGCSLNFSPNVSSYIAELGCIREYGARNLRRVIRKQVEDVISLEILNGNVNKDSEITVDASSDGLVFLGNTETNVV